MPKLRQLKIETAIIDRYRRRESSLEEALIEMYLAGVSVRRFEDVTEALWGTRVSPSMVNKLNQKLYEKIEAWRTRPLERRHPYVYLDGLFLRQSLAGEMQNVSVLVAIGVSEDGYREVLGAQHAGKEDKSSWLGFLRHLEARGLDGVQLFVSDARSGLVEALGEVFPHTRWQRCMVHFYRNVFTRVPSHKLKTVADMLKAIHAQADRAAAARRAHDVVAKLRRLNMGKAADILDAGVKDTLNYYAFPTEHWRRLRTNNPLERLIREVRHRTRVVGYFPDGHSALMLVGARLRHVAGTRWESRRYLDMDNLTASRERAPVSKVTPFTVVRAGRTRAFTIASGEHEC